MEKLTVLKDNGLPKRISLGRIEAFKERQVHRKGEGTALRGLHLVISGG